MPGQKGESWKNPVPTSREGALRYSENRWGGDETPHMQGWNSGDPSQLLRGGISSNANKGSGGKKRGSSDY